MSTLEIFATIITLLSVFLAVKVKTLQYPVGIVGSILYFFVFWGASLYFSAFLQIFFLVVQFYGWWYWLYGDKGKAPKITQMAWGNFTALFLVGSALFAYVASLIASKTTNAAVPFLDAAIFGMSVIAQFLLDRKKIQTWMVWFVVNVVSIYTYQSQGLGLTTGLYCILLANTFWGYFEWNKQFKLQK